MPEKGNIHIGEIHAGIQVFIDLRFDDGDDLSLKR